MEVPRCQSEEVLKLLSQRLPNQKSLVVHKQLGIIADSGLLQDLQNFNLNLFSHSVYIVQVPLAIVENENFIYQKE